MTWLVVRDPHKGLVILTSGAVIRSLTPDKLTVISAHRTRGAAEAALRKEQAK